MVKKSRSRIRKRYYYNVTAEVWGRGRSVISQSFPKKYMAQKFVSRERKDRRKYGSRHPYKNMRIKRTTWVIYPYKKVK